MISSYSYHIEFTDGSNPYCNYHKLTKSKFNSEIRKWEKNFDMKLILVSDLGCYYYKATPKIKEVNHE